MKIKQIVSGVLAFSLVCGLTACKSGEASEIESDTTTTTGDTINASEFSNELENKTIKWMSYWDINPDGTGRGKSAELIMFEKKFGGTIEYYMTTYENQYSDLSTAILSGEGIDFFPVSSLTLNYYINGIINGLFQPVDEYVDFNSELLSNVKKANDLLMINGKHYALVHSVTAEELVIYNKRTIEEYELEDPVELLENGNWNWDTYNNMLAEFVDNDSGLYGIDGWWVEQPIYLTTGKPFISLNNGMTSSNIKSPEIERALNYIYDMDKNSYLINKSFFEWTPNEAFIGSGKDLFFTYGVWSLRKEKSLWVDIFGEDVMFVPMPKDPDADKYYLPCRLEGYLMCTGAQNPEGVIKFIECTLTVAQDEVISKLNHQKLINDYGWREDMADMMFRINEMTRENPVCEFYDSTDVKSMFDTLKTADLSKAEWNSTVETYSDTIDTLVDELNQKLAEQ